MRIRRGKCPAVERMKTDAGIRGRLDWQLRRRPAHRGGRGKAVLRMGFHRIDRSCWAREAYFAHYFSDVPCTYSMTVKLDITHLREKRVRLYPAMLYALTTIVNRHAEFRTALNSRGELGVYDEMIPSYTVFHKDTETFSTVWTEGASTLEAFCRAYEQDVRACSGRKGFVGKPDPPANCFTVSMIPWTTFEGFHLNLQKGYDYLLPMFTIGKYYEENERTMLPLAIQVHHAVCDGFHVCRFVQELQALLNG